MSLPNCPKCGETYTYQEGHLYICPMCFHEWTDNCQKEAQEAELIRDSNGNIFKDGDDVIVIKDLKLGKDTIKQGTKVKNIQIVEEEYNGHDILCKLNPFGMVYLKSSVVKK